MPMQNFVKIGGGPKVKTPRILLVSDAHGRIVLANCHTPSSTGKLEYLPAPCCAYLSIYISDCLENSNRLLREDERGNDQMFDEARKALETIEMLSAAVIRAHPPRAIL